MTDEAQHAETSRGHEGTGRRRVHIDTDPGLDDLLALALAFASPELEVCGVTTVSGNATLDAVTENAQRFLALLGHPAPLGRGAARPIELVPVRAEHFHGDDGRRGVTIPAVDRRPLPPAAEVLEGSLRAGVDTIIALGPLTNVAIALRKDPERLAGRKLYWMGGTLGPGNATPLAEFNAVADPVAARIVLSSELDIHIVGLDVTESVQVDWEECHEHGLGARRADDRDKPGGTERLLGDVLAALCEAEQPTSGQARACLHDPCAVLAATGADLFRFERKRLSVDTSPGRERGRLLESPTPETPSVAWATEVRHDRVKALFFDRLGAYCERSPL